MWSQLAAPRIRQDDRRVDSAQQAAAPPLKQHILKLGNKTFTLTSYALYYSCTKTQSLCHTTAAQHENICTTTHKQLTEYEHSIDDNLGSNMASLNPQVRHLDEVIKSGSKSVKVCSIFLLKKLL